MITLKQIDKIPENTNLCILYNELKDLKDILVSDAEIEYTKKRISDKKDIIILNQYNRIVLLVQKPKEDDVPKKAEKLRRLGFEIFNIAEEYHIEDLVLENNTPSTANILDLTEGLILSAYQFTKYKSKKEKNKLKHIFYF